MTNKLTQLLNDKKHKDFATLAGTAMHKRLQFLFFDANGLPSVNDDIVAKISKNSELVEYFGPLSKTEVPIAGYINGKFTSRRIDRLYVNNDTRTVVVLDYKTDTDKERFYNHYIQQLGEYRRLLSEIYPGVNIVCKILWLNDFTLENVI